ncbi:MAG: hypothetical protein JSW39_03895 [Desulfobacterales bacterium]|nr:MAG: hypothetical protein JSW39_03895 [Desulfobacterales bacterium]
MPHRTYGQQRLYSFGLTMIVMGACFGLYYLGFFGSVEGPLDPGQVGERLVHLGVTRTHVLAFALLIIAVSASWNWIYNLVSFAIGSRLTCNLRDPQETLCGAPVKREKIGLPKNGRPLRRYLCSQGHKRPAAHFHPVKKGIVGHTLWVTALIFGLIVFHSSYHLP